MLAIKILRQVLMVTWARGSAGASAAAAVNVFLIPVEWKRLRDGHGSGEERFQVDQQGRGWGPSKTYVWSGS